MGGVHLRSRPSKHVAHQKQHQLGALADNRRSLHLAPREGRTRVNGYQGLGWLLWVPTLEQPVLTALFRGALSTGLIHTPKRRLGPFCCIQRVYSRGIVLSCRFARRIPRRMTKSYKPGNPGITARECHRRFSRSSSGLRNPTLVTRFSQRAAWSCALTNAGFGILHTSDREL